MPELRTLNIRNLPETNTLVTFMTMNAVIKGLALSFAESLRSTPPVLNGQVSGLFLGYAPIELLSVGALRYRDVWDGSIADDSSMKDDFFTLRTFSVDFRKTSDGACAPLLTIPTKTSAFSSLIG